MVLDMATLTSFILVVAIILAIVAIVCAVTRRAYQHWLIGAVIALVVWLILTYVVHA